jgi:hypothetical protein
MALSNQERVEINERLERVDAILAELKQVPWTRQAQHLDDYLALFQERARLHDRLGAPSIKGPA